MYLSCVYERERSVYGYTHLGTCVKVCRQLSGATVVFRD